MTRRLTMLLALLALVAGLAACGTKEDVTTVGETEGSYLDVGGLKYQVQISRQLNPRDVEDKTFLVGLPPASRNLREGQVWFAVFMRVENDSDATALSANRFTIETTQDEKFHRVPLQATNTFVYQQRNVPPKGTLPENGSVANAIGINGQLLLYKIPRQSLENRPLELSIESPSDKTPREATVALDV
jgi:hypothetical protein